MKSVRSMAIFVVILGVAGCGSGATQPASPAESPSATPPSAVASAPPSSTPGPTASAAPTSSSVVVRQLPGAIPDALLGTWVVIDAPNWHFVFSPHRVAHLDTTANVPNGEVTAASSAAGVEGDVMSIGPRVGACDTASGPQTGVIGMYRWTLVSPSELRTVALTDDACPRSRFLIIGDFRLLSRSQAPFVP